MKAHNTDEIQSVQKYTYLSRLTDTRMSSPKMNNDDVVIIAHKF